MVKANLRSKVPALMAAIDGRIRPHHLKMIGFSLEHIDFLRRQVEAIEQEIEPGIAPFREARELICTIPGVKESAATEILVEIGTDMGVFHSDAHLASWAGVSPGNFESAGNSKSGQTPKGNRHLKWALVQAARVASRTKDTRLRGRYLRLKRRLGRDGDKKAVLALAHSILPIAHFILSTARPYVEFGSDYGAASSEARARLLVAQVERLGYTVTKAA